MAPVSHLSRSSRAYLTVNAAGNVRVVEKNGRRWFVAPLAMITPGVLPGSDGALMYEPEDCASTINLWHGIPITANHPYDPITNDHLDASTPGVWDRQGIGWVKDPWFDGKSRAYGWFDADLTRRKAPAIYEALKNNRIAELSTGLRIEHEMAPQGAHYNGREFYAYARNHQPDHLAALIDAAGACSINDGCGIGVTNARPKDGCSGDT